MKASDFKRSKQRLDQSYKKAGSSLIALESLRIHIPARYVDHNLATIEDVSYIFGFFAMITDDNYFAASTIPSMFRTEPDRISKAVVDDVNYIELSYNKGSKVVASTDLVIIDNLVHRGFTEMYGKGKIPWYYNYEDLPMMFTQTAKYNGFKLSDDPAVLEYMAASLCRDPDDPKKYYRHREHAKADVATLGPLVVPIKNVSFSATNVVAKLGGSYFNDGMTGALINPAERKERLETMLRI